MKQIHSKDKRYDKNKNYRRPSYPVFLFPVFAASENKLANDGTRQVKAVLSGKKNYKTYRKLVKNYGL